MTCFREFQTVRLISPQRSACVYCGGATHRLPKGKRGTIIHVLGAGEAYEVEFTVCEPRFAPSGEVLDYGQYCTVTLRSDQVEPTD